ncbi:uncharacterized protein MONOS_8526 [Monocercomonoides exilis]|uniref:uncharacterized protein n=1 Tax=Monocercomonoides exilis TaxID=2049356 RepID=UPI00355A00A2|nr:hypothetical protein MONOS_8526 [Monocercomonoides exilis]|eukprot:MONOS_8526.1-p1 / transcript=MONOS_8526.1 / gene=MONOS_8526 / organism=Monocercomonoides_exilis_PA203 / gene_product=unspecified product / transcript_product=unspecified product / location=Mono_scaffold00324:16005-17425(-) / protein_length=427 / sequence_SO=supercontig / SO=protein_coding / is_pseudo=false
MTTRTERFSKLFDELERCREGEQMQKIEEMNGLIDEMNKEDIKTVFTRKLFNKIYKMIEERTLSWGNAILLLKNAGYCKKLKYFYDYEFSTSLLSDRFQKMIIKEEEKKEEKNERLLVDLCECFALLNFYFISDDLRFIIVPCLLKAASKKEGNEETQKEVEMALLALSNIGLRNIFKGDLFLDEIKEIILYNQEHHNLTRLAYQSAWLFLMNRYYSGESLEKVITNKLHFAREARREIEELKRNVDWKRNEEENGRIKVDILRRWLYNIDNYFTSCELWNEELAGLIGSIVQVFLAARGRYQIIRNECVGVLIIAARIGVEHEDILLKSRAVEVILEEIHPSTLNNDMVYHCLRFCFSISERLKEKTDGESTKIKRKELKRKIFEKMEEEGHEDITTSLYGVISFLSENGYDELPKNASEYLTCL